MGREGFYKTFFPFPFLFKEVLGQIQSDNFPSVPYTNREETYRRGDVKLFLRREGLRLSRICLWDLDGTG